MGWIQVTGDCGKSLDILYRQSSQQAGGLAEPDLVKRSIFKNFFAGVCHSVLASIIQGNLILSQQRFGDISAVG